MTFIHPFYLQVFSILFIKTSAYTIYKQISARMYGGGGTEHSNCCFRNYTVRLLNNISGMFRRIEGFVLIF